MESFLIRNLRIKFDKIYLENISLINTTAEFTFDSDIIIGTNELESKLSNYFFNNFIYNQKCFSDNFKLPSYYHGLKFFYCKINLKRTLYNLLPSINFFSNDLNFTFKIANDELFKIENKYIYLQVLFPISEKQNYFVLGRSMTLKYPFVYNPDLTKIGAYIRYKEKIKSNNRQEEKYNYNYFILLKIMFIIFILVILILFGLKFLKILYGINRKEKAYELSENYEYYNEEIKNKDINNSLNNKDLNSTIEMKIKT